MITVFGASGVWGGEVVRQLTAAGLPVRPILRRHSGALPTTSASPTYVNIDDVEQLQAALSGCSACFILSPCTAEQRTTETRFLAAAARASVPRVVKASGLGANVESDCRKLRWSGESEAAIRDGPLPWTLIRPNFFFQNFLRPTFGRWRDDIRLFPEFPNGISMVDIGDVATVTVRALLDDSLIGQTLEITGPNLVTTDQVCLHLSSAGRRCRAIPLAAYRATPEQQQTRTIGTSNALDELLEELSISPRFRAITPTVHRLLERSPLSLPAIPFQLR